jgi:hypothetical protein
VLLNIFIRPKREREEREALITKRKYNTNATQSHRSRERPRRGGDGDRGDRGRRGTVGVLKERGGGCAGSENSLLTAGVQLDQRVLYGFYPVPSQFLPTIQRRN